MSKPIETKPNKTDTPDWEKLAGLSLNSVLVREALPPAGDPQVMNF